MTDEELKELGLLPLPSKIMESSKLSTWISSVNGIIDWIKKIYINVVYKKDLDAWKTSVGEALDRLENLDSDTLDIINKKANVEYVDTEISELWEKHNSSIATVNNDISSTKTTLTNQINSLNEAVTSIETNLTKNVTDLETKHNNDIKSINKTLETKFNSTDLKTQLLNLIYPVGSIYMSIENVSPNTFLGGTWVALQNRFLIGASSTYAVNSTGGSKTVKLTEKQMPSHSHTATVSSSGDHTHDRGTMNITGSVRCHANGSIAQNGATGAFSNPGGTGRNIDTGGSNSNGAGFDFDASKNWTGKTSSSGLHVHTTTISTIGGSEAHENMPPYLAVYMWKRTK